MLKVAPDSTYMFGIKKGQKNPSVMDKYLSFIKNIIIKTQNTFPPYLNNFDLNLIKVST